MIFISSSTCAQDSWKLLVKDGEQRQLEYWSSDWKYRWEVLMLTRLLLEFFFGGIKGLWLFIHVPSNLSFRCLEISTLLSFSAFSPSTIDEHRIKNLLRNDADVVGLRNGCSFTGWTGSGFDEDSFSLNAGATDRWYQNLFQCLQFHSPHYFKI